MLGPLRALRRYWHSWSTRRKMNRVFSRGRDPYRYGQSDYERRRLVAMSEALGREPLGEALEVGCAEGAFTRLLVRKARRVTALDISSVAVERARNALVGAPAIEFAAADLLLWRPPAGRRFDAIVLGDVLYYLDKPLVREDFSALFPEIAGWLAEGGKLLLAHGFVGEEERGVRQSYRERFEAAGLRLESERALGEGRSGGDPACLISLLLKPKAP